MKILIIPVTPFQQNCCLVWDETSLIGAVVDPGGDVDQIVAEIDAAGVTVEKIVLTHGHVDHAAGAAALQEILRGQAKTPGGVPIEGPEISDLFLLQGLAENGKKFGITEARNVTPDRWLTEGDTLRMAGVTFDVLHCPGHSPGSVVLVDKAGKFAFVGDVLFRGSVGRTDFAYGDRATLIAGITNKLLPLGDDVEFICGHGPGSTIGVERRSNPFLRRI